MMSHLHSDLDTYEDVQGEGKMSLSESRSDMHSKSKIEFNLLRLVLLLLRISVLLRSRVFRSN